MHLLIVGGGWAGLSAAVNATARGWQVTLLEAARQLGGRARSVHHQGLRLDNGQHILIGAYTDTLALMRQVGLDPHRLLHRQPLTLLRPDGSGLTLPALPAPWNMVAGVLRARDWRWNDRMSLLQAAWRWQRQGFECSPLLTVAQLCTGISERAMSLLIEPLCVSALNTPAEHASAAVFLRVLRDALWSGPGGSDLLLPRVDLAALLPHATQQWLVDHGAQVHLGHRWSPDDASAEHDALVLACPPWEAARLTAQRAPAWSERAQVLPHKAIATVYVRAPSGLTQAWPSPMLALPSDPAHPAQFVFDRGRLMGTDQDRVLACVVSASEGSREDIQARVMQQLRHVFSAEMTPITTVIEKRATFACVPGLVRPTSEIAPGWWACGDYVQGPYPATLEGAVRSGREVIDQIAQAREGEGRV
jgi:squalene-associated FAD-dependent desaturase